jgi:mRNA interferase MazF
VARGLSRGEIRLYQFKPPDKQRPVLVLTREPALSYLTRVSVAPITSSVRDVPSEVALDIEDGVKTTCAVNLHNVVTVPKDGLGRRLARLSDERMQEVCVALAFALGCSSATT